jgi:hypothetical protein
MELLWCRTYQVQVRASGAVGARSALIHGDDVPEGVSVVIAWTHSSLFLGMVGRFMVVDDRCGD